ncbi:MAG: mechanosensitive ion channel family protein, partial [Deltaproteobacteria bacterium]
LYVPTLDLPAEPDYTDESGAARVQPLHNFDALVIVRKGDRWVISRSTVEQIDALYANTFSGISEAFQDLLPEIFFRRIAGVEGWQLVYFGLLLVVSLLVGRVAHKLFSDWLLRFARRFGVQATAELVRRIRSPLTWVAGGAVFLWGIPDLQLTVRQSQVLLFSARAVLAIALVVVAVRIVDVVADLFARKAAATESKIDDQVVPMARRLVKVLISGVAILVLIENMGVDVAGLVAGLGIGGLAVALAAKDTLENVFGSVVIFLDRPFQVGDWVIIDGTTEGVIEEVGFRTTRVRTFQKSLLSVPNGKVAMARIDNYGLRPVRRFKTVLSLTYDTPREKMEQFVERVRALLRNDPDIWPDTLEVHFHTMGESSLDVLVYAFFDVDTWSKELAARQRVQLGFMAIAEDLGVQFAFPSTSVYVESMPEPGSA